MHNYYKGKNVWVTGASSGIGEALCKELDQLGARVLLSSRNQNELLRVLSSLKGEGHRVLPLDLENYTEMNDKVNEAISAFKNIDILINNGGVSQRSLAIETSIEVDKKIFDINFFGTVALTKAIIPYMIQRGSGHIVTVSSVTGIYGTPYRSAYAASKHALHGFFDSLRAELYDKNIQVTLVCPGFIKTNITMNALTGDGSPLNIMDKGTSSGLDVSYFTHKMLKGVSKRKNQLHIGGTKELFGVFMKRFFPGIFAKMIAKMNVR